MSATKHTPQQAEDDAEIMAIDATGLQLLAKQVSQNDNQYTALVTAVNPWIFGGNTVWRREIEQHRGPLPVPRYPVVRHRPLPAGRG